MIKYINNDRMNNHRNHEYEWKGINTRKYPWIRWDRMNGFMNIWVQEYPYSWNDSGLMRWISTDEDWCIATKAAEADRSGEDKTDSMKDAKRVSTVTDICSGAMPSCVSGADPSFPEHTPDRCLIGHNRYHWKQKEETSNRGLFYLCSDRVYPAWCHVTAGVWWRQQ